MFVLYFQVLALIYNLISDKILSAAHGFQHFFLIWELFIERYVFL